MTKLDMDPTSGLASVDVAKAYVAAVRELAPGSYPRPAPARKIVAPKLVRARSASHFLVKVPPSRRGDDHEVTW
jgi:hypothetical protein